MKTKKLIQKFRWLLISIILGLTSCSDSQDDISPAVKITLTADDVTATANVNSSYTQLFANSFEIPQTGENIVWDYSSYSLGGYDSYTVNRSALPATPAYTASYTRDITYSFLGTNIICPEYYNKTATNLSRVGFTVPATTISLPNSAGTISIAAQNVAYTPEYKLYTFPLNYNDNVSYPDAIRSILATVNIPGYGYNNAPGANKITYSWKYQIVGWGKLITPISKKQFDVLLFKGDGKIVESLLINGSAAPDALLSNFGQTQNKTTEFTDYYFWTKGYPAPILTLEVYGANGTSVTYADMLNTSK